MRFISGVIVGLLLVVAGFYVVVNLGMFPVGADNPPGKFERKMANTAMDEYVDHNAPKQANPMQPTSANLIDGAHEYEEHCAFCHGGAAQKTSPMRTKFNPPVPQLLVRIPHDDDAHLWWVTKHGIRLTGMPSWDKVLSDDTMWKIIAFIKNSDKLPPDVQAAWQQSATMRQGFEGDERHQTAGQPNSPANTQAPAAKAPAEPVRK